jgi:coniferyl-aldehyde dehydrogenase
MDSLMMKGEIFGPILPIVDFENINTIIDWINSHPKPLACYYFGRDAVAFHRLETETSSGALI